MKRFPSMLFILFCCKSICKCDDVEKLNTPLYLTPLIDSQQIKLARAKALVQHQEFKKFISYSGYLTVNKLHNSNIFFWYFPSRDNSQTSPLLLWLNGGPGASSLYGLFNEIGPFFLTGNSVLETRNFSWNINHNIIYIDNPVGAGYSFTDNDRGYVRNQNDVGRDLLQAMLQFFKLFPELNTNPFYVTGESYAGKYVPALAYSIKWYNAKATNKINIKGFAIGNGFTDPLNQMNRRDYLYQMNLIDFNGREQFSILEEKVRTLIQQKKYTEATLLFDTLFASFYTPGPSLFKNLTGYEYFYNILLSKQPASDNLYANFVQRADIRRAIHVGDKVFVASSAKVRSFIVDEYTQSMAPVMAELLEDYKALIFSGNLDIAVPHTTTENYLRQLVWSGAEEYRKINRKEWYIDGVLAGYLKIVGNLNEVIIRNSGHFVPTDQPLWGWKLITAFTHGQPFINS